MGFLEEIELRRQQEVDRQKVTEMQRQLTEERRKEGSARWRLEEETEAKGFIADSKLLIPVVEQLNQLGYRDYLKDVSKISGFGLGWTFYMRYPHHNIYFDAGQRQSEEKIRKLLVELLPSVININWSGNDENWSGGISTPSSMTVSNSFFGDNIVTEKSFWGNLPTKPPKRWFAEPQEVGLGIRFSKFVRRNSKILNHRHDQESIDEIWHNMVYLRIMNQGRATITGSNQFEADFLNISGFDESLAKAIKSPATVYNRKVSRGPYYTGTLYSRGS